MRDIDKFLGVIVVFLFGSCVSFQEPDNVTTVPEFPNEVVSIGALLGEYLQSSESVTYSDTENYVEGVVISSDEGGNYYQEIVLQDRAESATAGIRVLIGSSELYSRYPKGMWVNVKLDGLTLGVENGVLTLGTLNNGRIEAIPGPVEDEYILRTNRFDSLIPLEINLDGLTELEGEDDALEDTNILVRINDVQFNRGLVLVDPPMTYASEATDEFDGERLIEHCLNGQSIILSTSTFADFKSLRLPQGRGRIDGILTKNFFGDTFNLVINSPKDVEMSDNDRCDPPPTIFLEDFDEVESVEDLYNDGWLNYNVNGGDLEWSVGEFNNNGYLQVSGYNSDEGEIDIWMISPVLELNAVSYAEVVMDIQTNFNNGAELKLLYSTDNFPDPINGNWQELIIDVPEGSADGFGEFESIAPVALPEFAEVLYLAIRYVGSDPTATTRYHIDNFEVRAQPL
jgi:hypothetical protein